MENEMLERVEQLEEKVKRLEGELARTMKARKISTVRMFGEGLLFLVFGVVVVGPIIAVVISIFTWLAEKKNKNKKNACSIRTNVLYSP
ncbi:hypothetical protein ORM00_01275 [Bacillus cereus]|nr:hypothetical protein [Bacillus cereus]KMP53871.1 hypothetical protein TU59_07595 [Bacillus cereus]MDZ4436589.1 hypothetical protein [Bacillus cereus]MDZ4444807.1 hypothetical protein [Bacillus cereus]MDZ4612808.1 hypothetical protein [Bacillus cereus]PFQ61890.1 hypothetical protein COK18_21600 [Bacillus cereus]